jgi:hypothetical protein
VLPGHQLTGPSEEEDPGVDVMIILQLIFKKWDEGGRAWTGLIWLRTGVGGGLL